MGHRLSTAVRGATAGLVATGAMSAFMVAVERLGIMPGQPPRMIVDRFAELPDDVADAAALVSHGAYGAAAGAAFALLAGDRRSTVWGVAYGLLVWAGGYEGWVPAFRVMPPAHRDRPSRVAVVMTAHVIFGYTLGRRFGR